MAVVAISLKMYFSRKQMLDYCACLVRLLGDTGVSRRGVELAVLPDFLTVPRVCEELLPAGIRVGSQDICADDRGAFTGEISGRDLAELGVSVAEIGHVERRLLYHEDRPLIHRKVLAAWRNGLIPLLCVGEKERVGSQMAAEICTHQIQEAVGTDMDSPLWVAYEPLWAIGADKPAPKEYVREVCECLREILHGRQSAVLYGGSAGPGVLTDLGGAVDGVFLGRFAHEPSAFVEVVREASQLMGPVVTEMR